MSDMVSSWSENFHRETSVSVSGVGHLGRRNNISKAIETQNSMIRRVIQYYFSMKSRERVVEREIVRRLKQGMEHKEPFILC